MNKTEVENIINFPIQYIEIAESIVKSSGGDVDEIYKRCNIDNNILQEPNSRIDAETFKELINIVLENLNNKEPLSLQILKHMPITMFGLVGVSAITSKNLGDALDIGLRYFPIILPCFELTKQVCSDYVCISIKNIYDFGSPANEILKEILVANFLRISLFSELIDNHKSISKEKKENVFYGAIYFRHSSLGYSEALNSAFKLPIHFLSDLDYFILPRKLLDVSMQTQNRGTLITLVEILDKNLKIQKNENHLVIKVRELLDKNFSEGKLLNAESIASFFSISTRTLSRRLAENKWTLASLIEDVRMDKAENMLINTNLPLYKIAKQLGYSNISSFSRAYRRVKNKKPSDLR